MTSKTPDKPLTSPWRVVEVFVVYLVCATAGEFMGAAMGEGSQLSLAVLELGLGLLLSLPALSGKPWGWYAMAAYLLYYGLSSFALLALRHAEPFTWAYAGPLSAYFAAGGLKMALTRPRAPDTPE